MKPSDFSQVKGPDFIDYKAEFVELAVSEEEMEDSENLVNISPIGKGTGSMNLDSFVELLRRARIRHQTKTNKTIGDR